MTILQKESFERTVELNISSTSNDWFAAFGTLEEWVKMRHIKVMAPSKQAKPYLLLV